MGGYGVFAEFYDRLTTDVAYGSWADYLLSLFEKHGRGRPETLPDLACGSGSLSLELASRGVTVNAVAPGFIDIHTHSDACPLVDYEPESKLHQGITTEITGNCGTSILPSLPENSREIVQYFFDDTSMFSQVVLNEKDRSLDGLYGVEEYARAVAAHGCTANYGQLVGHGTLRGAVMGFVDRDPEPEEMERLKDLLERELRAGAFGMSLGLIYPPSAFCKREELVELAKAYQEETGVEVEVWPIAGDDYYQNLKTYMASESGPTVFTLNSSSEIAEMSGYLADLSDLEVMGKVQENLIAMVDGKKTGVPMTAEGFGIIYNKDMVDPEAISTMDGLIAFIEEEKAAGITGLGLSQEGYFLIGQILNFPFAVQDDPVAFCQQVFSGEVKLADVPEFQEFAKLFVAIRENQVNPLEVTYDGNCGDFATGKTAAIHQGNWCYTMFSSYDIDFEMGMVGLPVGGSTAIAVGIPSYWFVNADASEEEQQLGKDFLNWLYTSETGTDYLMNKFGFLPVVDGMTSEKLDPISASVADAIASGNIVDWTFNTEWPASVIMNDLVPVAEEFFTTDMTEADFLTALNDAFVTAAAE